MKKETYKVNTYCSNCSWVGIQEIDKGTSVEVLSTRECPICGWKGLKSNSQGFRFNPYVKLK